MILLIEHAKDKSRRIQDILNKLATPFVIWSPYLDPTFPSDRYSHIIVGGGALHVEDIDNNSSFLYQERHFLLTLLDTYSILGICLGAEILAKISGSEIVTAHRNKGLQKVTLTPSGKQDSLFDNLSSTMFDFNHRRRIIPRTERLEILAKDEEENLAAFRLKGKKVWGVQFHPENTAHQGEILVSNFLRS